MKQKVVIDVEMDCKKCQAKAMKIAFLKDGVISVALKGEKKNRIEVIGEGIVDAAGLTETLRKKVGFADLVSVEEIKVKDDHEELNLIQ